MPYSHTPNMFIYFVCMHIFHMMSIDVPTSVGGLQHLTHNYVPNCFSNTPLYGQPSLSPRFPHSLLHCEQQKGGWGLTALKKQLRLKILDLAIRWACNASSIWPVSWAVWCGTHSNSQFIVRFMYTIILYWNCLSTVVVMIVLKKQITRSRDRIGEVEEKLTRIFLRSDTAATIFSAQILCERRLSCWEVGGWYLQLVEIAQWVPRIPAAATTWGRRLFCSDCEG